MFLVGWQKIRTITVASALTLTIMASPALAEAPPAGATIGNQATVVYEIGGETRTIQSNIVQMVVQFVPGVDLTEDSTRRASPGQQITFPHTVENTGNGPDQFVLSVANLAGDDFDLTSLQVFADLNGDGVPDDTVPITTTPVLGAGEAYNIVIVGNVPGGQFNDDQSRVVVTAVSIADGTVTDTNTDTVLVSTNGVVGVNKAVSPLRGQSIAGLETTHTYTLFYTNTGNATVSNLELIDELPDGVTYIPGSARWSVTGLTALTDADTDTQGTTPDTVSYDFGESAPNSLRALISRVPPGISGSLTYQVEIQTGYPAGRIPNVAAYRYNDGVDDTGPFSTNTAVITIGPLVCVDIGVDPGPVIVPSATADGLAEWLNPVTNNGTTVDTFDITVAGSLSNPFPAGTTIQLFQADGRTPLLDSDADGIPDVGPLAPGATYNLVVRASLPVDSPGGGPYEIAVTASSSVAPDSVSGDCGGRDTIVDQLADNTVRQLTLDPDHEGFVTPGGSIVYAHTLTNLGNVTEGAGDSIVALIKSPDPDTDGWQATIYFDANRNQLLDPDEVAISDLSFISDGAAGLEPGEDIILLVEVIAPGTALADDVYEVVISAVATQGVYPVPAPDPVADTDLTTVAQLRLRKEQAVDFNCDGTSLSAWTDGLITTNPDDCLIYRVVIENNGTLAATNMQVSDLIPEHTVFAGGVELRLPDASVVTPSDDPSRFTLPADGTRGTLQVDIGSLAGAQQAEVRFRVRVPGSELPNDILNLATVEFTLPTGETVLPTTNTVVARIEPSEPPVVQVVDCRTGVPVDRQRLGDQVCIKTYLPDCNVRPDEIDIADITVIVRNPADSDPFDKETVLNVSETGVDTGIFLVDFPSDRVPNIRRPEYFEDGVLEARTDDLIEASGCGSASTADTDLILFAGGFVVDPDIGEFGIGVEGVRVTLRLVLDQALTDHEIQELLASSTPEEIDRLFPLADVRDENGNSAPSQVLTDNTGRFDFPFVATEGRYIVIVEPPAGSGYEVLDENALVRATVIDVYGTSGGAKSLAAVSPNNGINELNILIRRQVSGIVFSSITNEEVPARVHLLEVPPSVDFNGVAAWVAALVATDDLASHHAEVFQLDGVTPADSVVAFDAIYFPFVRPGRFVLVVVPNDEDKWSSPSIYSRGDMPALRLAPERVTDDLRSYQLSFNHAIPGSIAIDIPVDPRVAPSVGEMALEKAASVDQIEVAEFLSYKLKVVAPTNTGITDLRVVDNLPAGFKYVRGTAKTVNGVQLQELTGSRGPQLEFVGFPDLNAGQSVSFTYRVEVGAAAAHGDGINRAVADGDSDDPDSARDISSNVAVARVEVREGVLAPEAIIIGKVFLDHSLDGTQDFEDGPEWGVPGVRLFLENGSFVITDGEGKFSFYGVSTRKHVLKVDTRTLPRGARLSAFSHRHLDDPESRLVDLKSHEIHKANFALIDVTEDVLTEVRERRVRWLGNVDEIETGLTAPLDPDGAPRVVSDPKSLPASGVITPNAPVKADEVSFTPVVRPVRFDKRAAGPTAAARAAPTVDLTTVLPDYDGEPDFMDINDGDTLPDRIVNLRVKGHAGGRLEVRVNGEALGKSRLGQRVIDNDRQIQADEYIGVRLTPGRNRLELIQYDPFGNERDRRIVEVVAPDGLGQIQLTLPTDAPVADGVSRIPITISLLDAEGVPVTVQTPITLETNRGRWLVEDLDHREPGVQIFVRDGSAQVELRAPYEPGDGQIRVTSGRLEALAPIIFLPELRPLVAAGIVEANLGLSDSNNRYLTPSRSQDAFEEEIRGFSREGSNGDVSANGRAAMFIKGQVKDDYLLTASYDSERDSRDRLFRDIEPDEFYPVYGDAGIRGFEAQSTSSLYVRVDKQQSYAQYGDFTTNPEGRAVGLASYNRSFTGAKAHLENGRGQVNLWGSNDNTGRIVEELRANGTSGPFELDTRGVINSEQIEIVTRDRDQQSVTLSTVPMTRLVDYTFEPFTGRLLFRRPIPSLDSELNPVFIRVTYEIDQGGDDFWVYGADGSLKLTENLELGGTCVRDENPIEQFELSSVNATLQLATGTYLIGEAAFSDHQVLGQGVAERLELVHDSETWSGRVFAERADQQFVNDTSSLGSGRVEGGAEASWRLSDLTVVRGEAIYTENLANNGVRKGVSADIEQTLWPNVRLSLGGRYSHESTDPAGVNVFSAAEVNEYHSLHARLTAPMPWVPKGNVYGEYEQDVSDSARQLIAVGGEYQFANSGRLYARHEFISSLGGAFELNEEQHENTTVVGIDTTYMKNGHYFNEYRQRDAVAGRDAEVAIGLRNDWPIREGLRFNTSFERLNPVQGKDLEESTALTGAVEYTANPLWKGTARLELRKSDTSDTALNTFGYARKLDQEWTLLGKSTIYVVDNKGAGDSLEGRLRLGFAYRPVERDEWNALFRYEVRGEDDRSATPLKRVVHIASTHVNYQYNPDWLFSGRYAGKWLEETADGFHGSTSAHVLAGRAIYEINERFDTSLQSSVYLDSDFQPEYYGLGVEVAMRVVKNVRVAIGYNFFGYQDDDLINSDYNNHGVYLNLVMKFDEKLFDFSRDDDQ